MKLKAWLPLVHNHSLGMVAATLATHAINAALPQHIRHSNLNPQTRKQIDLIWYIWAGVEPAIDPLWAHRRIRAHMSSKSLEPTSLHLPPNDAEHQQRKPQEHPRCWLAPSPLSRALVCVVADVRRGSASEGEHNHGDVGLAAKPLGQVHSPDKPQQYERSEQRDPEV